MDDKEFVIFKEHESVAESFYKDFVTGVVVTFLVYISQGSTFWEFITGGMFIIFVLTNIQVTLGKAKKFKGKKELQQWLDSLPDERKKSTNN